MPADPARTGDVFEIGGALALVTLVIADVDPNDYQVRVAVLAGSLPITGSSQPGRITIRYTAADIAQQLCWVEFTPPPLGLPATGVDPFATLKVRFDEPVAPASLDALESMVAFTFREDQVAASGAGPFDPALESVLDLIGRLPGFVDDPLSTGSGRLLFGPIEVGSDCRSVTLAPSCGLADGSADGAELRFGLALLDGPGGVADPAGNALDLPDFAAGAGVDELATGSRITLSGAAPTNRSLALRF